ncbi:MAG: hypothetical protein B6245_02920 [Desulfobacteraceae bacterium 4572_88]|nr:MAG: hypothetical protein B6245_02920 [Desulfobacteraceae bacterium 4572_88]
MNGNMNMNMNKRFPESELPGQQYFRIGEVSAISRVSASELRFWEGEFPEISPRQTHTGQKIYGKKDVGLFLKIRELLYDEKLSFQEVRDRISGKEESITPAEIRAGLLEIRKLLE